MPASSSRRSARRTFENSFDLRAVLEFSTIVNATLDLKFLLGHFLLTIMGKCLSLRAIILLSGEKHQFRVENVKGLPDAVIGRTVTIRSVPNRLLYVDRMSVSRYPWLEMFKEQGIRLLVPLVVNEATVGIAGFAPSNVRRSLSEEQGNYVKSLANIAAAAIAKSIAFQNLDLVNRQLSGKIQELNTLFELGKEFNAVLDQERLIKLLMFSIMGQVGAARYFICLSRDGHMNVVASRLDGDLSPALCGFFSTVQGPKFVRDISRKTDLHFRQGLEQAGVHVLIPLSLQQETKAIFGLGEKLRGGSYTPSEIEFLSALGNLALISLENARLFREGIEKQKLEDELIIAREIQRGLLPASLPEIPHFRMSAVNISSKQVGGDYYDVIAIGNGKFVLAIGDVSGKGTPASLLMANLQATIRALVPLGLPLSELTRRVNELVTDSTGSGRFITFFWGILDAERRTLNYVSAGHNPPFVFHADGHLERLDKGGLILGIMKSGVRYEEGETTLQPGDVLVLFTDGVSEAMDLHGEEWGEEPLERCVRENLHEEPGTIVTRIVQAVKEHSKDVSQSDDITLVVAKAIA